MSSPPLEIINIEEILAPISEDSPTGVELTRSSPSLDNVVTLRDRSKDSEKKIREEMLYGKMNPDDPSPPDPVWKEVIKSASELLSKESKDLRVAAWLAEALMHEYGFAGLRDGLKVCHGLCNETFWPNIYPRPDEFDGHEMTVAQLGGLTGDSSISPINEIPVTNDGEEQYSMNTYADAATPGADTGLFDKFELSIRTTPSDFYRNLVGDLDESVELLNEMSTFLDANCIKDQYDAETSPSVVPLRNRLRDIRDTIGGLAKDHLAEEESAEVEGEEAGELVAGEPGTVIATTAVKQVVTMGSASVDNREDAFKALNKIADFFTRTEPHSPIAHAIRQAVTWGGMSYEELQNDLIQNPDVRQQLFLRVGVPKEE